MSIEALNAIIGKLPDTPDLARVGWAAWCQVQNDQAANYPNTWDKLDDVSKNAELASADAIRNAMTDAIAEALVPDTPEHIHTTRFPGAPVMENDGSLRIPDKAIIKTIQPSATNAHEERMLKWFTYNHLPANLQAVSAPWCELAVLVSHQLKSGPERTVALRKLLEGKDAAVRAALQPGA